MNLTRVSGTNSSAVQETPTFGQALKQSWADTFSKSKALGALRVLANITVVGALVDLAVSGIAHKLGKLGRNAQLIAPSHLMGNQPPQIDRPATNLLRDSFSGSQSLELAGSSWKPVKTLGVDKGRLETPGQLCAPSKPQTGKHVLHTEAFKAFKENGVTFGIPGSIIGDNVKNGKITIEGNEYDYQAQGKVAKGSGAGIWMVKLSDPNGDREPTEFVIKANPMKGDVHDDDMGDFWKLSHDKDVHEVRVLDQMSGNPLALHFHGGYSLDDGTLVYGMEKAEGDMMEVAENRQKARLEDTLDVSGVDQHLVEMAKAISDLHATGQVHGDVKSDNFMLGQDGTARIADFGESLVTAVDVRDTTLKGDVDRYAVMAFNLRYGVKETEGTIVNAIKSQQHELEEAFTIQLSGMIHEQKQLIKSMESNDGDVGIINQLKEQVKRLEDPTTALDAMLEISGKDVDESLKSYAVNQLLLEALSSNKPDFTYMAGFTRKLEKLIG